MIVRQKLKELGITLPLPAQPVANYVPVVVAGGFVVVSGQLPLAEGKIVVTGKLGESVDIAAGKMAARLCFLNVLGQIDAAIPQGVAAITQVIRLGGFIAATPGFVDHAQVMNGASDLAVELFGVFGQHARSTIGVASLPMNAPVEIEAMFSIS